MVVADIENLRLTALGLEYGVYKSIVEKDWNSYYFYGELYKMLAEMCMEMTLEWK